MRDLNDPVTVSGESGCKVHCAKDMRRRSQSIIRESGNLLRSPVHSFRRKRVARESLKWLYLCMFGVCFFERQTLFCMLKTARSIGDGGKRRLLAERTVERGLRP